MPCIIGRYCDRLNCNNGKDADLYPDAENDEAVDNGDRCGLLFVLFTSKNGWNTPEAGLAGKGCWRPSIEWDEHGLSLQALLQLLDSANTSGVGGEAVVLELVPVPVPGQHGAVLLEFFN